jgi:membrane-bound metal-dependent hydrolase YbcI (DUF457 family)
MPDIDYFGWPVAHRTLTHSVVFALVGALVVTAVFFRDPPGTPNRVRTAAILALAFLSHGLLDGLSQYSWGIEYLAPFSSQRFRLWWTPLGDRTLAAQLAQEAMVVLLPAVVLGWIAFKVRRSKIAPA